MQYAAMSCKLQAPARTRPPGVNVLLATLERGRAHEQATAIGVLAGRGNEEAIVPLARHLWHESTGQRLKATTSGGVLDALLH